MEFSGQNPVVFPPPRHLANHRATEEDGRMSSWETLDRYLILSSDAHAGAPMAAYKDYLDPLWHDDFDAWLAGVVNPWVDIHDTRNYVSADRIVAMDAEGVTGEVL